MESNKLFAEFPPTPKEQWKEKAIKDLKGADFDKKLVWNTYDGFPVQPFYTAEDLGQLESFAQQAAGFQKNHSSWINYAEIRHADPKVMNEKGLLAIKGGATGLLFEVDDPSGFNFNVILNKISAAEYTISFKIAAPSEKFVLSYFNYLKSKNIDLSGINGFCDADIFEQWITKGITPDLAALEKQLKITKEAAGFYGLVVHSEGFVNAGCNTIQELAFLLNKIVDYADDLTDKGLTAAQVMDELLVNSAISGDYFFEIAKIRALRVVLAEILNAYGITAKEVKILSSSSLWSKSFYDPNVNMLRNTTEAMAAILGGCNALLIRPHNAGYETPTDFSTRIALNISNLLQGESYLDKVADPSKGSYYIEYLTKTLSEKALTLFREIENAGGFVAAFKKNLVQEKIDATRAKKELDVATRKQVYVGVNQYVNAGEASVALNHAAPPETDGIRLLAPQRATLLFEKLRERTQQYFKSNGTLPTVYLACFGNLAMRKARASFSTNFFTTAGFRVPGEAYHENILDGVKHSLESNADIVVLCASDEDYEKQAKEFAVRFKQAGSGKTLVLAGYPAGLVDELKDAGVDIFIHVKSNAIDVLSSLQDKFLAIV